MTTIDARPEPSTYADPVARLVNIGEPAPDADRPQLPGSNWPDPIATYGIGAEHVDDLVRMAKDPVLHDAGPQDDATWGPVHAWRALGRLRAASATASLLELVQERNLDDWIAEELPIVFGMIGAPALPAIDAFLADPETASTAGATAIAGLMAIAQRDPASRPACIAMVERTLRSEREDADLNASAVAAVLELEAVEAIEAVRHAFRRNAVDLSMAGDVEDVEIGLGLRARRATPRPPPTSPNFRALQQRRPLVRDRLQASAAQKRKKIGRNDPCPCGSGRKYKKCCGSSTNDGPAPA